MAKLTLEIQYKEMATTAKTDLLRRVLEQLYYSILFSGPDYSQRPTKWTQWLRMGFDVSVREQPRVARPEDKMKFDLASMGAKTEITVTHAADKTLAKFTQILTEVDNVRANTQGTAPKWEAAMALPIVKDQLVKPMTESMAKDGLRPDEITNFANKVREVVTLLTEDNVASVKTAA